MTKSARIAHAIAEAIAANPQRFEGATACVFVWHAGRNGPDKVEVKPSFEEHIEIARPVLA